MPNPQGIRLATDRRKRLKSVVFHAFNSQTFFSSGAGKSDINHSPHPNSFIHLGRAVLEHKNWSVELQEVPEARNSEKELKSDGGYGMTHVGFITEKHSKSFGIGAAESFLTNVRYFLSFANAMWTIMYPKVRP